MLLRFGQYEQRVANCPRSNRQVLWYFFSFFFFFFGTTTSKGILSYFHGNCYRSYLILPFSFVYCLYPRRCRSLSKRLLDAVNFDLIFCDGTLHMFRFTIMHRDSQLIHCHPGCYYVYVLYNRWQSVPSDLRILYEKCPVQISYSLSYISNMFYMYICVYTYSYMRKM